MFIVFGKIFIALGLLHQFPESFTVDVRCSNVGWCGMLREFWTKWNNRSHTFCQCTSTFNESNSQSLLLLIHITYIVYYIHYYIYRRNNHNSGKSANTQERDREREWMEWVKETIDFHFHVGFVQNLLHILPTSKIRRESLTNCGFPFKAGDRHSNQS